MKMGTEQLWNDNNRAQRKNSEKTLFRSATLCTINLLLDGFLWNFRDNVEKYGKTGRATDDSSIRRIRFNLMFFWPCIMNWLYINYQLDALIIIYS